MNNCEQMHRDTAPLTPESIKNYGSVSSGSHHSYHPIQLLESVCSHKVLVLIIQNNLKWNKHITASVSKAAKRLQIFHVPRQGDIPGEDLIAVYYALIRSVLEYCCVVWHNAPPSYRSNQIERVQRQALRIIYPGHSYRAELPVFDCLRLDERRDNLLSNDTILLSLSVTASFCNSTNRKWLYTVGSHLNRDDS